ncbi:SOS response-associated peptidase family protein [Kineococcus sp. SYSU DK005]|uniref:SOS response-associated peptidase family protein n=1 Tax=Kineococcus sp. SYSU DK005 TaxID=3383126 RepID=UPI003D7C3F71
MRASPDLPSYALRRDVDELVAEFEVEEVAPGALAPADPGADPGAGPRTGPGTGPGTDPDAGPGDGAPAGAAPGGTAPVVLERFRRGEPDAPPSRSLRPLRWGLVPSWAPDAAAGPRAAGARVETLLAERSTGAAALARRCLVPADAWRGPARGGEQPPALRGADGSVLSLGGVYEFWRDPALAPGDPAAWVVSFAVVTAPAAGPLPARVPLVVPRDLRDAWLDPTLDEAEDVAALLAAVLAAGPGLVAQPPAGP